MNLQNIETLVLMNLPYDRYTSLSTASTADKQADFAALHQCVNLAREEIKILTQLPSLLKTNSITTTASIQTYSLATDFDLPIKAIYTTADGNEYELSQVYPQSLLQKLGSSKQADSGDPALYMIEGTSSDVMQVKFFLTPVRGGETAKFWYLPILESLSIATDEDIIMKKYANAVIKFATAYAKQFIKQNMDDFAKWYLLGKSDVDIIRERELSQDSNFTELPDNLTRQRRMGRFSR